jgi:hypothetical protein
MAAGDVKQFPKGEISTDLIAQHADRLRELTEVATAEILGEVVDLAGKLEWAAQFPTEKYGRRDEMRTMARALRASLHRIKVLAR